MRAAVAGLLSALATALAQSLDSTCTRNTWSYNREQRSPCTLWQDLTSLCTTNGSPAIVARYHHISDEYVPPREDDPCACNVVAFNLASACALCQDSFDPSDLIPETEWRASCTHYNSTGVAAPQATQVKAFNLPSWAALPERGGVFQFDVARQLAAAEGITELPPATGSASTTSTRSDPASATSTDPAPSSTAKKKTDVGAIVGGVMGGLLGLAVTGLLAWLLLRYRNQQRNKTAFATAREPPSEKTFGLPSDIKVQHFVPPPSTSGHASYDSFPPSGAAGALSAHPFAANYAVQRNIQSDTVRSYTSSSNYDALAGHSIMPFDTQSATGTYSSAPNTMDVAARSGSESPFGMRSMSPTNHPYANPVVHDGYSRTTPDTPVARTSPWAAMASTEPAAAASTALPTQTPARKLPPLRVPQPVRPPSVSTAGDLSAASWSSAAPLIQPPRQSSIDEVVGNGGASKPLPRRPLPQAPSSWSHE